jgi:hypothetical protein
LEEILVSLGQVDNAKKRLDSTVAKLTEVEEDLKGMRFYAMALLSSLHSIESKKTQPLQSAPPEKPRFGPSSDALVLMSLPTFAQPGRNLRHQRTTPNLRGGLEQ